MVLDKDGERERKKRESKRVPDGETERDNFICVDSIFYKKIYSNSSLRSRGSLCTMDSAIRTGCSGAHCCPSTTSAASLSEPNEQANRYAHPSAQFTSPLLCNL